MNIKQNYILVTEKNGWFIGPCLENIWTLKYKSHQQKVQKKATVSISFLLKSDFLKYRLNWSFINSTKRSQTQMQSYNYKTSSCQIRTWCRPQQSKQINETFFQSITIAYNLINDMSSPRVTTDLVSRVVGFLTDEINSKT